MIGLDVLNSAGNLAYLISYSVRDILWLRLLSVVGGVFLMAYYYLQPTPLWVALAWGVAFQSVNAYWIVRLFLERRPVRFTDAERRLRETALRNMSDRQALKVLRSGTWTDLPAGTHLLTQGETASRLSLIASGSVDLLVDGVRLTTFEGGRFAGAEAFLCRDGGAVADVSLTTTAPTRVIAWSFADLARYAKDQPDLLIAIEASLGLELSRSLRGVRREDRLLHQG